MTWVAWRQIRLSARVALAGVVLAAVLLALTGPMLAHDYRADGLAPCAAGIESTTNNTCGDLVQTFLAQFSILTVIGGILVILPAVVGMFWGAPLLAREYEAGTHHLAWTQSVSRTRWLATKLAIVGALSLGVTTVVSLAYTWWSGPRDRLGSRINPAIFSQRGIVPIAYVAFALVLGVALGSVVRRVVPAMALTLVVLMVVLFANQRWVRPELFDPVELRYPTYTFFADEPPDRIATDNGWLVSAQTVDREGHVLSPAGEINDGKAAEICGVSLTDLEKSNAKAILDECGRRLGLTDVVEIHPASRFWRMQAAESALFAVPTAGLLAFCFWRVRRHGG
jgi:hypothetical protein